MTYDKVCSLQDDYGDASDEVNCTNNFRCGSKEFIPVFNMCDGSINCFDYSDECNNECDLQVRIFPHIALKALTAFLGLLATILNTGTLYNTVV